MTVLLFCFQLLCLLFLFLASAVARTPRIMLNKRVERKYLVLLLMLEESIQSSTIKYDGSCGLFLVNVLYHVKEVPHIWHIYFETQFYIFTVIMYAIWHSWVWEREIILDGLNLIRKPLKETGLFLKRKSQGMRKIWCKGHFSIAGFKDLSGPWDKKFKWSLGARSGKEKRASHLQL